MREYLDAVKEILLSKVRLFAKIKSDVDFEFSGFSNKFIELLVHQSEDLLLDLNWLALNCVLMSRLASYDRIHCTAKKANF